MGHQFAEASRRYVINWSSIPASDSFPARAPEAVRESGAHYGHQKEHPDHGSPPNGVQLEGPDQAIVPRPAEDAEAAQDQRVRRQQDQALGRARGGFSTKLHLKVDLDGRPLAFQLTEGQASDSPV